MLLVYVLLALALPLMASQPAKPDPDASPEEYRQQIAASIQDLTSGRRPRDPRMSGASTGRLLLEGVLENVKIYRLHKQEKVREAEAKGEEERKRRERRTRRHHRRDSSREREHRHGSHRHRSRERDGDAHRHRRRHRSAEEGENRHRRRHCHPSQEDHGDRDPGSRVGHEQHRLQRSRSTPSDEPPTSSAQHLMSGVLHAAEALLGPDGTPFGSLPTRSKGVGLLPHAKTMYRHIKAEQDAGHRSKGFAEKRIDAFLQKRRDARSVGSVEEEVPLIDQSGRGGRDDGREQRSRRQRKARSRKRERRSRGDDYPIHGRVEDAAQPSGTHAEHLEPSRSSRSGRQPTPFVEGPPPPMQPSRRSSRHDRDGGVAPLRKREGGEASEGSRSVGRSPSVRIQSPAPAASVKSEKASTPSIRSAPSIRDGRMGDAGDSRRVSRAPTIRVQSPTPPKSAKSIRSPTPFDRGTPPRVQSPEPELGGLASPVRSPAPSHHRPPSQVPTPPPMITTPYPAAPSAVDMPVPVIPSAPPMPPPPLPPLSLPQQAPAQQPVDPDRNAFLASIQCGVKLKKVCEEDKSDKSAARRDEARSENVTGGPPTYEGTPHSHDIEALEHAQAVEEKERRQEEERAARTVTPLTAPQPRVQMPTNFQDELAAKVRKINLAQQGDHDASEARPSEGNVVRPRASNETWRTVFADHEEENRIPDRQFRQDLRNRLSAGGTPQPPAGMTKSIEVASGEKMLTSIAAAMPSQAQPMAETPAPDVFMNLAVNVAGSGWQSGQGWNFSNVPKDGSDRDDGGVTR